jgi:hypothetical protein
VLGSFDIALKDGNNVVLDFTARFKVDFKDGERKAAIQLAQVWTDPTEMIAAKKAAESVLVEN